MRISCWMVLNVRCRAINLSANAIKLPEHFPLEKHQWKLRLKNVQQVDKELASSFHKVIGKGTASRELRVHYLCTDPYWKRLLTWNFPSFNHSEEVSSKADFNPFLSEATTWILTDYVFVYRLFFVAFSLSFKMICEIDIKSLNKVLSQLLGLASV